MFNMENNELVVKLKNERIAILGEIKEYDEIIKKQNNLRNQLVALDSLLSFYGVNPNILSASDNSLNGYDPNFSWSQKILYALKKIKSGYASEIANTISELDPKLDKKRVKEAASFYLSKMLKSGQVIKLGESGKKYKFGTK
jgi:hypothetical protein